jgi:hypothetical protein
MALDFKKLQGYFDAHKAVDSFFVTTDSKPFHRESDARGHQRSLKNEGEVVAVTRAECAAAVDGPSTGDEGDKTNLVVLTPEQVLQAAQEGLATAQTAYDAAMAGGDATVIAEAKKALTAAKTKVTKLSK